ncbi:MAG: BlaI/MecI/CopY family transcriptional regulator [Patescibacteria group bacterium]|jgi:predicted transcriptional regulator
MIKPSFQLLGELERQIMEVVWRRDESTVRDIVEVLRKKRTIAYTTVMTVMNRLADKNILRRKDHAGAFVYSSAEPRESFFRRASSSVIRKLIAECGDVALAQFVEALDDVDPAKLAVLEKKLRQRRS